MSSIGDEFNTGDGLRNTISELFAQFMTPEVAGFLSTPISKALAEHAQNNIALPGGVNIPVGQGALFAGQVAIEQQTANALVQTQIQSSMAESAAMAADIRMNMRDNLSQGLFGTPADPTGFSALNMASDMFLYGSLGIRDLQNNLAMGGRYMGVVSPAVGGPGAVARNNNFSTLSTLMTADVAMNPGSFGGLTGGEVGTLVADLARTGNFNNISDVAVSASDMAAFINNPDGGTLDSGLQQRLQQTREQVQSASRLVAEFKRVLNTDVTGAIDQMNSLFGVDVASTFSPERLTQLSTQFSSAGLASGFTTQQVLGLGAASANQAQAAGFTDFTGGASAGILSAQLFRATALEAVPGGGNPFAFVNERRHRENLVRRVTGAQLSGLSRDIAGAAALIAESGGDVDAFLGGLPQDRVFDSEDVLASARQFTSISDVRALRDASFSQEGRRFLEQGVGTTAVLGNNAGFMRDMRADIVRRILRNNGIDADSSGIDFNGALTSADVRQALGNGEVANAVDRAFTREAQALGFGSLEEQDVFLRGVLNRQAFSQLRERTGQFGEIQGRVAGATDALSGFRALGAIVNDGSLADSDVGDLFSAFLGVGKEGAAVMGIGKAALEGLTDGATDLRKISVGAAASVLFNQRFGNRSATKEQVALAQEIFAADTTDERRKEAMMEFDEMVEADPQVKAMFFEQSVGMRVEEFKTENGKKKITDRQHRQLRKAEFLEQFETADGIDDAFKDTLGQIRVEYEAAAAEGREAQLSDADKEAVRKAERQAAIRDDLGGVKKDGSSGIIAVLMDILEAIQKVDFPANTRGG